MKSVLEVARELAAHHRAEDPDTQEVFLAESPDEVRLLEISGSIESWGLPEVLPVRFAAKPDAGIPYASNVILLSPEDWAQVQAGTVQLPADWGHPSSFQKIA
jgi:hypothetical protein